RAILAGERDPQTLAALSHPGIRATRDVIAKSLEGTWQPDLVFVLQQEVAMYDAYQQRIVECDQALENHLKGFADRSPDTPAAAPSPTPREQRRSGPKRRRKAGSHARSLIWAMNCSASVASTSRGSTGSMWAWPKLSSAKSGSTCRAGRTNTT